jgi:hypothetical protein
MPCWAYGCDVKQARWAGIGASSVLAGIIIVAAVVVLSVYKIAPGPPSLADEEAGYLATDALAVCVALAVVIALLYAVGIAYDSPLLGLVRRGLAGAIAAVIVGVAAALVLAYAIDPWMDPGEAGRAWFPSLFGGGLLCGLVVGAATAGLAPGVSRDQSIGAAIVAAVLAGAAFFYLAGAFSEYNQCWVNDEFPLATEHTCAGY